ncbi:MAG: DUF4168 domain-containing protein [Cryomorphaceae bacterium]|nr:DUF4168 domain-containing protein [Cryomorphaceae bacterium]
MKHILTAVLTSTVLLSYGCQQGKEVASETEGVSSVEGEPMEFDQQVPTGDVSEEELTAFVGIVQKLQPLGMEAQQKMLSAVQDEGLEPQRFSEIMSAQQMPEGESEVEISPAEMDKYEKAQDAVDKIQDDVQAQMNEIIEDNGMTTNRYEEIMMVVQQDQALMQRVQEMMQPDMDGQQAPPQGGME